MARPVCHLYCLQPRYLNKSTCVPVSQLLITTIHNTELQSDTSTGYV